MLLPSTWDPTWNGDAVRFSGLIVFRSGHLPIWASFLATFYCGPIATQRSSVEAPPGHAKERAPFQRIGMRLASFVLIGATGGVNRHKTIAIGHH